MHPSIPPEPSAIGVVIPVYNEAESLPVLHQELRDVCADAGLQYELIFVDDGSTDGSSEALAELALADPHVTVVTLVRNFGKSAAYTAGFQIAEQRIVATLDADLQDDPRELPQMLDKLGADNDLVVGWKQARMANEPTKALPSRLFNVMLRLLFGLTLHDTNCGYRVMRLEVARSLGLHGGTYRFIPILAHARGYRVVESPVQHRSRRFGASKYGPSRFWSGLLDLLAVRFVTAFNRRPLHFFGPIALLLSLAGGALEVYVLVMKYVFGSGLGVHIAAIVTGVMLLLMGLQMFVTGLLGEMVSADSRHEPFVVQHILRQGAGGGLHADPIQLQQR